jgi:hypothetical protein
MSTSTRTAVVRRGNGGIILSHCSLHIRRNHEGDESGQPQHGLRSMDPLHDASTGLVEHPNWCEQRRPRSREEPAAGAVHPRWWLMRFGIAPLRRVAGVHRRTAYWLCAGTRRCRGRTPRSRGSRRQLSAPSRSAWSSVTFAPSCGGQVDPVPSPLRKKIVRCGTAVSTM